LMVRALVARIRGLRNQEKNREARAESNDG
jgi:hypothetical protein